MVHILDALTRLENKQQSGLKYACRGHDEHRFVVDVGDEITSDEITTSRRVETTDSGLSYPSSTALPASYSTTQDYPLAQHLHSSAQLRNIIRIRLAVYIAGRYALVHQTRDGEASRTFAIEIGIPCFAINAGPPEHGRAANVAFSTLTIQQIQEFSDAYFNTFNVLRPILNGVTFTNFIVARLLREGYGDGDAGNVLALMVLALGKVAVEGVLHRPVSVINGQPSGFRGSTVNEPPGLELFNEAQRRHDFVMTLCTLENVQINLLQATYYEATARHLDFWRSTVAASMACQVLVRYQPIDWSSTEGDLIKRAYWTCELSKDLDHLDLDLPQTGIHTMEDEIPLPYFREAQEHQQEQQSGRNSMSDTGHFGSNTNEERNSHFQYHSLAVIALRSLIARIHNVIHECERAMQSEPLWRGANSSYQESSSSKATQAHQDLAASTA
ncbi:hypothetical protein LTR17_013231 [Elasticomyces elasticus]|nr:hypothetical protein LTR17_013231 [Elasticomyces elasticus]